MGELDIVSINQQLRQASPEAIIRWALTQQKPTIVTTSFGKNAAALLHLSSKVDPQLPAVWIDTGYNLRDTYVVADKLMQQIPLDYHVFSPKMTSERRNATLGGIPTIEDEALHKDFTYQVKLEPFDRAIDQFKTEIWITGIRQQDTEHRKTLDILSWDARGLLRVAPLFYWTDEQIDLYMQSHNLLSCRHYFDPTKVKDGRECGLHTSV